MQAMTQTTRVPVVHAPNGTADPSIHHRRWRGPALVVTGGVLAVVISGASALALWILMQDQGLPVATESINWIGELVGLSSAGAHDDPVPVAMVLGFVGSFVILALALLLTAGGLTWALVRGTRQAASSPKTARAIERSAVVGKAGVAAATATSRAVASRARSPRAVSWNRRRNARAGVGEGGAQ